MRWVTGVVCALLAFVPLSRARAYEDTLELDLGVGYGARIADSAPQHGVIAATQISVGIGNAFSARVFVRYGEYFGGAATHIGIAGAEAVYALDILEVVPFFGLGLGAVGTFSANGASLDFELHPVVGVDWLVTREWVLGVDIRAFFLPASWSTTPVAFDVVLRAGFLFEV